MEPQAKPLTLRSFFGILRRQWVAMVIIVVVCVVAGAIIYKKTKPAYESVSGILVQSQTSDASGPDANNPLKAVSMPTINIDIPTQIEILESESTLDRVLASVGVT